MTSAASDLFAVDEQTFDNADAVTVAELLRNKAGRQLKSRARMSMQPKKLTGWLILLIVWIGFFGGLGAVRGLKMAEDTYGPYISVYTYMHLAITVFQLLLGASIAAWVYTAWVLYRREPGTLARAQTGLLVGAVLRIAGNYAIPLLAGLPSDAVTVLIRDAFPASLFVLAFTGGWYLYLTRSHRVRDVYTG